MMEMMTPTAIVLRWQEAVNQRDEERLVALSDPYIEIVGPRGSAFGHDIVREWLNRAGLRMTAYRLFVRGDRVVVAQHALWHSIATGETIGQAEIASYIRVANQKVLYFARCDHLDEALQAAGLSSADEQPFP